MSNFWESALIRAIKTFCQTCIATIGTSTVMGEVNWRIVASASALSFILSIMTSIVCGLPEVKENNGNE